MTKFFSSLTALFVLIVGISRCAIRENAEREKKKEEFRAYLSNLDYSNPVRYYKDPNAVFDEIDNNKYRFKQQVDGKMIQVTGYINDSSIEDDYFSIEGYGTMVPPQVSCYPLKEDIPKMINLSAGQTVLISGIASFDDFVWNKVSLKYCKFSNTVPQRGTGNLSDWMKIFKY